MDQGAIRAVIPMKPLEQCKLRLAPVLDKNQRAQLTLWMLSRVVGAAKTASAIGEVVVLGGDEAVHTTATSLGARWQADNTSDLNGALGGFYAETGRDGMWMLFLAGDLPMLGVADLDALVGAARGADLILGAGARDGTNAILLRPELPFTFQMGSNSLRRHREQAASLALSCRICKRATLHGDIDLPSDLAWLERELLDLWEAVGGTRQAQPAAGV